MPRSSFIRCLVRETLIDELLVTIITIKPQGPTTYVLAHLSQGDVEAATH